MRNALMEKNCQSLPRSLQKNRKISTTNKIHQESFFFFFKLRAHLTAFSKILSINCDFSRNWKTNDRKLNTKQRWCASLLRGGTLAWDNRYDANRYTHFELSVPLSMNSILPIRILNQSTLPLDVLETGYTLSYSSYPRSPPLSKLSLVDKFWFVERRDTSDKWKDKSCISDDRRIDGYLISKRSFAQRFVV